MEWQEFLKYLTTIPLEWVMSGGFAIMGLLVDRSYKLTYISKKLEIKITKRK